MNPTANFTFYPLWGNYPRTNLTLPKQKRMGKDFHIACILVAINCRQVWEAGTFSLVFTTGEHLKSALGEEAVAPPPPPGLSLISGLKSVTNVRLVHPEFTWAS
jgi:hypothetical protein